MKQDEIDAKLAEIDSALKEMHQIKSDMNEAVLKQVEEIDKLNQRVSLIETKIVRKKRGKWRH